MRQINNGALVVVVRVRHAFWMLLGRRAVACQKNGARERGGGRAGRVYIT